MKDKHFYHDSEPQFIMLDLPHLRNGGEWRAKDGGPKARMALHLGWLKCLGMTDADAQCMLADSYWDCHLELREAGAMKDDDSWLKIGYPLGMVRKP